VLGHCLANELRVAESNGIIKLLTGSSQIVVSAHAQWKYLAKKAEALSDRQNFFRNFILAVMCDINVSPYRKHVWDISEE